MPLVADTKHLKFSNEMFSRKKKPIASKPFSRVIASRWLIEYCGILPHCAKQGTTITHHLFCSRISPKQKWLLLEEGIEVIGAGSPSHVLWCTCELGKDHGSDRLLFRRYLDITDVAGSDWKDWVAFKLTQHLQSRLLEAVDFHFIVPCNKKNEYFWCAYDDDFDGYWTTEINVQMKRLVGLSTSL